MAPPSASVLLSGLLVSVRVRPAKTQTDSASSATSAEDVVAVQSNNAVLIKALNKTRQDDDENQNDAAWARGAGAAAARAIPCTPACYRFAHAFEQTSTNDDVYRVTAAPLASRAIEFFSGALLAYGQTGSGKTHTLFGSGNEAGLGQRLVADILARVHARNEKNDGVTLKAYLSFVEIYQEAIEDLLVAPGTKQRARLKLRAHPEHGTWVEGACEPLIETLEDALELTRVGIARRRTASHDANHRSSRSHAVLTIKLVEELAPTTPNGRPLKLRWSRVAVCDLAGAERVRETNASGVRLQESCAINRGLSALGRCVRALAKASAAREAWSARKNEKNPRALWQVAAERAEIHIPCRESKLTSLLAPCLSGLSLCSMVCCVSPHSTHLGQTRHTLQYASDCQSIRHESVVTANSDLIDAEELMREFEKIQKRDGASTDRPNAFAREGADASTATVAATREEDSIFAARIRILEEALARAEQQRSDEAAMRRRRRAAAVLAKKQRRRDKQVDDEMAALARKALGSGYNAKQIVVTDEVRSSPERTSSSNHSHALHAWDLFWHAVATRQAKEESALGPPWTPLISEAADSVGKLRAALLVRDEKTSSHAATRCIASAIEQSVQRAVERLNQQLHEAQDAVYDSPTTLDDAADHDNEVAPRCASPTSVTRSASVLDRIDTYVLSDADLGSLLGQINALSTEAEGVHTAREELKIAISDVLAAAREADAVLERASETLIEEHRQCQEGSARILRVEKKQSALRDDDASDDDGMSTASSDSEYDDEENSSSPPPLASLLTVASSKLRAISDEAFSALQAIRRFGDTEKVGPHAIAAEHSELSGVDLMELVASFPLPSSSDSSPTAPGASAARAVREHAAGLRPVVSGDAKSAWGDTGALGALGYAAKALARELARRKDSRDISARQARKEVHGKLAAARDAASTAYEAISAKLEESDMERGELQRRLDEAAETLAQLRQASEKADSTTSETRAKMEEILQRATIAEARAREAEESQERLRSQLRECEDARRAAEARATDIKLEGIEAKLSAESAARAAEARAAHAEAALRELEERERVPATPPTVVRRGGGFLSCGRAPSVAE